MIEYCAWVKGIHTMETCVSDVPNKFMKYGLKYCPWCGRKIKVIKPKSN